MSNVTAPRCRT